MADSRTTIADMMSPEARTQFEVNQKAYDPTLTKDASLIPPQVQIDVMEAESRSEVDALVDLRRGVTPLAAYQDPPDFSTQKRRCFTENIVPFLSRNVREAKQQKLAALPPGNESENQSKTTLVQLFQGLDTLDKDYVEINSKRLHYMRG